MIEIIYIWVCGNEILQELVLETAEESKCSDNHGEREGASQADKREEAI